MTRQHHEFEDLECLLAAGWRWSEHASSVSEQELAAWAERPDESGGVDAMLASDAELRRAVIDLRLHGLPQANEPSPELRRRVGLLMPFRPAVIGRIGGWAAAAAAAVLLAIGGWRLGSTGGTERSLDRDTLAVATFGIGGSASDEEVSFLTLAHATKETRP
jgi:hypothetical protein